jgi:SOS-response transcriptional repressor LexA
LLSISNKCLTRSAGCARVRRMVEPLQPRREKTLRFLARRAGAGEPLPSAGEGRPKMIWITEKGWEAAGRMSLMGRIAAGRGLEAVATDEAYSLAAELLVTRSGRRCYLLRVVGQSMVGARIEDGDLLVVEEDEVPPDEAVVVALLRGAERVA